MLKGGCKAFDAQDATVVSPNNAKFVTRFLHQEDILACNDTNNVCAGENLWKTAKEGEKTYSINMEDFTNNFMT